MKLKEIAKIHGFNRKEFESFCYACQYLHVTGLSYDELLENEIDYAVKLFKMTPTERNDHYAALKEKAAAKQKALEEKAAAEQKVLEEKQSKALAEAEPVIVRAKEVLNGQCLFALTGARGRSIKVYPFKAIITTDVTIGSVMTGNATDGEKTIYFKDVIGIQYKDPALTIGYLQLETAAPTMNNKGSNFFNENTFTFEKTTPEIESVYAYIVGRLDELNQY